jgi:hypothetical protein
MRLIFLPGLGEDEEIFDEIRDLFSGSQVFMNWDLLSVDPRPDLNVMKYARQLVSHFRITKEDVIIGHSTGGWIALYIKQVVGCRIVQLASWTDGKKVINPVPNRKLTFWMVKKGMFFTNYIMNRMIEKYYKGKPSEQIFTKVFSDLIHYNRDFVINQMRVIMNPVKEKVTVTPDLRIHAKGDSIVRYPDEEFVEVPGDHFTVYTHPEKVYEPIKAFLERSFEGVK